MSAGDANTATRGPASLGPSAGDTDLLGSLPALVMGLDESGRITFWNRACMHALGYFAGAVVGVEGALDRMVPGSAERARLLAWWRAHAEAAGPLEADLHDAWGQVRTVLWQRIPGPGPQTLGLGHDVTEQRTAARELRSSRELLRTAFAHTPMDFWIMDAEGRYTMVNPAAAQRWGNHVGKRVDEAGVPDTVREHWQRTNAQAFAGRTVRGEVEYPFGDERRTFEYVLAPIRDERGEVSGVLGINSDITERKAAERARAASEATKHAILDALPDLMFRMSADGRYLDFHAPAGYTLLARPEEFLGRRASDVLPRELAERCHECIARTLRDGGVQRYTYSMDADPVREYEVRMTACGPGEVVVLVRNISELCQAEQSLRESESRYRALFEASPLGLFVVQDGRVVMANPAGRRVLGAPDDASLVGAEVLGFVADADRAAAAGCVATALRDGHSPAHVETLRRLDGGEVTVEASGARIELGGRVAVQITVQDITQRLLDQRALREADERLRQSQKMEALGQLAAGVAHDFNNLLTAIFGYVSIARSSIDEGAPAWTALDGVQAAAEQASGVIRSLLTFSRKAVTQFTPLDLVVVVSGALDLIRAGLPSSIAVEFHAPSHAVAVRGDQTLLRQVVINLALNARDAMPKGGTLRVHVEPADERGMASIRVEDTGEGVPEALRARIFEPFFTTKSRESSSGLGLSVAEGIVRSHGGTIEAGPAPGRGAAFTVRIPAQPAPGAAAAELSSRPEPWAVLVVDEARQVREVIGTALSRSGLAVRYASGVEGATRALARADPPVRAAIVNLDMPDGPECARRIASGAPGVALIALTGAETPAVASAAVLRKPFQVSQIPELVRRVLAPGPGAAHRGEDP